MQRLLLLGLNHSTAPLEVREKLAFGAEQRAAALAALRQQFEGVEAVLLCTCNRVELYAARAVHGQPRHEEMIRFLADLRGISSEQLRPHVYEKSERGAVEHLFSVASSLDSMVIGETQILGQVREAYDVAHSAGAAGAALNPLFQRAVAVGKQVMTDTKIAEGRLSVGSVAVDCAGHIFDHYRDKTVLCIGAGKMSSLVIQGFAALRPKRMLVCSRDAARRQALATRFGAEAVAFERLDEHLVAADVVVSSTGAPQAIITRQRFEPLLRLRRYKPVFFIDIALPRDIEPAVGELENVYLYNLDDLQNVVATTQSRRSSAIDLARKLVTEHVDRYLAWHRAREMGPLIDRLYQRHHQLAREEVERIVHRMPNLPADERKLLDELARRIVNKTLHGPVSRLREGDPSHGVGPTAYLHAMEKLFHLDTNDAPEPRIEPSDEQEDRD